MFWDGFCPKRKPGRAVTSNNCTVPWSLDSTNICTSEEDSKVALDMTDKIVNSDIQDCPKMCRSMPIALTGGGRKWIDTESYKCLCLDDDCTEDTLIHLTFEFEPTVTTKRDELIYKPLSLFAEVGGYVGIFVGYSLLGSADYLLGLMKQP